MNRIVLIEDEGGEAMLFENEQSALGYVEAPDVEAGVYRGYTEAGRLLEVCTDGLDIWIKVAEQRPSHEQDLRTALVGNISHWNPQAIQCLRDAGVDLSRLSELPTTSLLDMFALVDSNRSQNALKTLVRRLWSAVSRRKAPSE